MLRTHALFILLFFFLYSPGSVLADPGKEYEQELLNISNTINQGQLQTALDMLNDFIIRNPKSRIAYVMRGDIYKAMSGQLSDFGSGIRLKDEQEQKKFQHELKNRVAWQENQEANDFTNKIPASIINMGSDKYILVGEMITGRFFLFENNQGRPELVKDYYMSIGKKGYGKQIEGDNKTPLGLYNITHEIDGKELPDLYGSGAFPVDYPNVVDRWRKRTGYGIWLHGTPSDTYSRAPYSSEGCFVLSNEDYENIAPYIRDAKYPKVVLTEKISWLTQSQHEQLRKEVTGTLQGWLKGWESLEINRYLAYYDSNDFNFGKTNFNKWAERKKQVTAGKEFVQVTLDVNGIYLYPGEKDMFKVNFKQHYFSNNYQGSADKTLFWRKDAAGKWKIIYEGKQV
jgi:murein L,D-transpeptidase YafK